MYQKLLDWFSDVLHILCYHRRFIIRDGNSLRRNHSINSFSPNGKQNGNFLVIETREKGKGNPKTYPLLTLVICVFPHLRCVWRDEGFVSSFSRSTCCVESTLIPLMSCFLPADHALSLSLSLFLFLSLFLSTTRSFRLSVCKRGRKRNAEGNGCRSSSDIASC